MVSRAEWTVTPSCCHILLLFWTCEHTKFVNISRYLLPVIVTQFPLSSSKKYGPITFDDVIPHQTVTLAGCNCRSRMTQGLSVPKNLMFCLLTEPFKWEWASSSMISLSTKLESFVHFAWVRSQYCSRALRSTGFSCWTNWSLYGNIWRHLWMRLRVLREILSCWERRRVNVPGYLSMLCCTRSVFSCVTDERLLPERGRSQTEPVNLKRQWRASIVDLDWGFL